MQHASVGGRRGQRHPAEGGSRWLLPHVGSVAPLVRCRPSIDASRPHSPFFHPGRFSFPLRTRSTLAADWINHDTTSLNERSHDPISRGMEGSVRSKPAWSGRPVRIRAATPSGNTVGPSHGLDRRNRSEWCLVTNDKVLLVGVASGGPQVTLPPSSVPAPTHSHACPFWGEGGMRYTRPIILCLRRLAGIGAECHPNCPVHIKVPCYPKVKTYVMALSVPSCRRD